MRTIITNINFNTDTFDKVNDKIISMT